MARKPRIEYEGAIYHVINRGDRREPIMLDAQDADQFITTLGEACDKTDWQVHAFCLMGNHFHLVVETPQPNLAAGMHWFLSTYTSRFNRRHKLVGHLFSGRYKSPPVDGSGNHYLRTVCEYVHLNPVRAQMLGKDRKLATYQWSSYPHYLQPPRKRPDWLRVDRVFGDLGIPRDTKAGRRQFEKLMEERRFQDDPDAYNKIRRGWCFGDAAFRKELTEQMGKRLGAHHYGHERTESLAAKAERIVSEEMRRLHWKEPDLAKTPKGDIAKVRIARRLRKETTISLRWIAERLKMGTASYVNNRLYLLRKGRLE